MRHNVLFIKNERGAVGLKVVIALLILVAVIYTGIQLVPIYWDHWEFEDEVKTEVRFLPDRVPILREREGYLKNFIIGKLKEMKAEFQEKNVKVEVDKGGEKVKVEFWYARPHKLPFYTNPKQFHIKVEI